MASQRGWLLHLAKPSFRYGFIGLRDSSQYTICLGFSRGAGVYFGPARVS